ncbi:MAG: glycosyltransferase family 39 protein, partial [Chloroflexi bacterium]|nr:glycosyltransferase family 39 protein [Chloroflexota bacterium]
MILGRDLRPARVPLAIFFLLCAVYLFTYNGLLRSIDELVLFSMTESLLQRGSLETPQTLFAGYHNPVGRPEPFQALAAVPLYALAQANPEWGKIQTAMLFNILVTAATASLLWLILREMGYSQLLSLAGALILGLATISWPYTRTFFREPLVALAYTLAFWLLLRYRASGQVRWAVSCLIVVGLSIATKFTSIVSLPVFALGLWATTASETRRRLWLPGVGLALALGTFGTLTLWAR